MVNIWNGQELGLTITLDTETEVVPFTETPRIVTMQYCGDKESGYVRLSDINRFFEVNKRSHLVFHNVAFDWDVLVKSHDIDFHSRLENGLIHDSMLLFKLLHLAKFGFVPMKSSLAHCVKTLFNVELNKDDALRCNFGAYLGKDIEDIPEDMLQYGLDDTIWTHKLYKYLVRQEPLAGSSTNLSEQIQIAGAIALNHIYKNGIGFDLKAAKDKLDVLNKILAGFSDIMATYGWVRGVKGSKDRFDDIIKYYELDVPKTASGNFSTKEDDLKDFRYDNHFIDTYLQFIEAEKMTTFIRELNSDTINPRYNSLLNTGRTSCSKPNFQQLPRVGGIRELFVAREGHTFIITDYAALELATLSQVTYSMYGKSIMRDRINAGEDLHRYYASVLYKIKPEEVTQEQRQSAKAANFGFPGGLGTETFITFAKGYGLDITGAEAKDMKSAWFKAFTELIKYMQSEDGYAMTLTGRIRGDTSYCAEKNTKFQGLASDGFKIALYYLDNAGFKIVGEVHDEIICEVKIEDAERLLKEQERIMIEGMQVVCPDVKIGVESVISPHYCK